MKRMPMIIISLMIVLFGCGGGSNGGGGMQTTTYGTLTLTGGGTSIAGTQFQAMQSTYAIGGTGNQYAWVSDDDKSLTVTDYGNGYAGVEVEWEDAGGKPYYWYNTYTTGVTVGASSVTFNNVTISGHLNTTTSLTLNGTLNY